MSRSMLSNLAHAKCRVAPADDEVKALRALYELAAVADQTGQVIEWDELLRRRFAVCWTPHLPIKTCVSCGAVCTDCGTTLEYRNQDDPLEPADDSRASAETVVPVPNAEGDRHKTEPVDIVWTAVDDVARYVAVGDFTQLNSVLRYAGIEAPAAETARAVAACRDRRMHDAAATIVDHAGSRAEREVLEILRELNRNNMRADADALLERALRRNPS
ncbi:hypothetical protein [Nocardia sp. NBC_00511]|uniref:hypothetical protein n=1 Tax=Nocardia sp. NBC_00511 TaxID=2903591 RepID=UPI0030DF116B